MLQPTVAPNVRVHGPALREIRKRSGLSVDQLAQHIGVTRYFLYRLERSERGAKRATLEKLADALGVSLDVITYPELR